MSIFHTVPETFSIRWWRDLEIFIRCRRRSLKLAPFDRPYKTYYRPAIVAIPVALLYTIFRLFDIE